MVLRTLRCAAGALLIAVAASPPRAAGQHATVPSLQLQWHAPPGCLEREAALVAIRDALGAQAAATRARAVARVRIAQLPDGRWNADIWMYGPQGSGERSFAGATCVRVADAAALIVAMALAPVAAAEPDAGQPAPRAPSTGVPRLRFFAGVRLTGDIGSLPAATAGGGAAIGVEHGAWRGELDATVFLPQVARRAAPERVGGRFGLYTLALRGCFDALAGRAAMQLGPCLAAEAGVATGGGLDISDPESGEHVWAAALAGAAVRYAGGGPVAVGLLLEAGMPLRRPTWDAELVLDDMEQVADVFRASPLVGRASLSLAWLFP